MAGGGESPGGRPAEHSRPCPFRKPLAWAGSPTLCLILFSALACQGSLADGETLSGKRALAHVEKIVSFGPHPPGSPAQVQVGDYIVRELESYGVTVHSHSFKPYTPLGRLPMRNIWGEVQGARDSVLLLASHYDSKYFPDFPFVGANDGGSSTGLLLELARVLSAHNPTEFTLWFVFFDGEEALQTWTDADSLYGSREFVRMLRQKDQLRSVSAMLLLDLIGGRELVLRQDSNSTPWLNELIWRQAALLGYERIFVPFGQVSAIDDHIPFLQAGVPAVDLIDLSYPHWHQPSDTLDKLSAENLEIVGKVVLASLPEIARRLQ